MSKQLTLDLGLDEVQPHKEEHEKREQSEIATMPPYVRASMTSRAAAESVRYSAAGMRFRVLEWFATKGPSTDEKMMAGTGLYPHTGRARRVELRDLGFIVDSGVREPTISGRTATVWKITSEGLAHFLKVQEEEGVDGSNLHSRR